MSTEFLALCTQNTIQHKSLTHLTQSRSSRNLWAMKVIRAKSAGFCWGVERAIEIAREYTSQGRSPVYTDGPLIHNTQMMDRLHSEGIREVGDYQSTATLTVNGDSDNGGVMVVRAHGISPERRKYLKSLGLDFRDATCPDVGIIAGKIRLYARKGYSTVIFGDPAHPEIIGLLGYTEGHGYCISNAADIDALPPLGEQVVMVSQSTMFTDEFQTLSLYLRESYPTAVIIDTICSATKDRQGDIQVLVKQGSEALVIIGGHHSANTKKLALLAQRTGLPTYHIETARDIDPLKMRTHRTVGVTAGASTPEFLISEVCQQLEAIEPLPC
ncbi:MAG: 4-hydroxy-3-methylbut-2-enyl diphosphate reductase [Verrucomicrobiota bacterium]|nr:4-hydroxy-3-methylbut-2-enyl diphosphate reductase [Verrucomicrobiota bacterium]